MAPVAEAARQALYGLKAIAETANSFIPRAILTGAIVIAECIDTSSGVTDNLRRLSQRVTDVSISVSKNLLDKQPHETQELRDAAKHLLASLSQISSMIVGYLGRGRVQRLTRRLSVSKSIIAAEKDLAIHVEFLMMRLQFMNIKLSENVIALSEKGQSLPTISIEKPQKISSASNLPRREIPPVLQLIYGRDKEQRHVVETLGSPNQTFICLLGPGGIGKTSLALAVLHDAQMVETYCDRRYFLPCDALNSVEAFVSGLSQLFGLSEKSSVHDIKRRLSSAALRVLLMIDNFETSWESMDTRKRVEEVLTQLSEIPNLSICVTLRGAERPYGIPWSRPVLPPLETLDFEAAKNIFLSVADVPEDDDSLRPLLEKVDMVPLAVTLMAAQAQFYNCTELLALWEREKTLMVTNGQSGRLSSLEMSIEVSLSSERFRRYPEAEQLLQLLALLPAGIAIGEIASVMEVGFPLHTAMTTLLRVALAQRDANDHLRVLAPVREYVMSHLPMQPLYFEGVVKYFASRMTRMNTCESTISHFVPQIGNYRSVLAYAISTVTLPEVSAEAAVELAYFHFNHSNVKAVAPLILSALQMCRTLGLSFGLAQCLTVADIVHTGYFDAMASVEEAVAIFRLFPERKDWLARTLVKYAHVQGQRCDYVGAVVTLAEAESYCDASLARLPKARALNLMANIYCSASLLKKATSTALQGLKLAEEGGYCHLAGYCIQTLATVSRRRGLYANAIRHERHAFELDPESKGSLVAGVRYCNIGRCLFIQSKLAEAEEHFNLSIEVFRSLESDGWVAYSEEQVGKALLAGGDYQAASRIFETCLENNIREDWGEGIWTTSVLMAATAMGLSDFNTAWSYLARAEAVHRKSRDMMHVSTLALQGDVLLQTGHGLLALSHYISACVVSCKRHGRLEVAACIQRLGDFYFTALDDIETAEQCWLAALDLIKHMDVRRHVGQCLLRLGISSGRTGKIAIAMKYFVKAKQWLTLANDAVCVAICEQLLFQLENASYFEFRQQLPSPTFLGLDY